MSKVYLARDVFKPNNTPELTYVTRQGQDYEKELQRALKESGAVVSLNGPSKSGKTSLTERVVGKQTWVYIPCSQFSNSEEFWQEVLRQLGGAVGGSEEFVRGETRRLEGTAEVKGGVPAVFEAGASAVAGRDREHVLTYRRELAPAGPLEAVEKLVKSKRVLVIDDFHYLSKEVQVSLGRQIKDAAFKGVPIAILSVPHRGDDPVRAVPDLRGRVNSITLHYWKPSELQQIARQGFPLLGLKVDDKTIDRLVNESLGSPQLMQRLCLDVCHEFDVERTVSPERELLLDSDKAAAVFRRTARSTDFTTMTKTLEAGPSWGNKRTTFNLVDGTTGDVYRCILAAIAVPPPRLSLTDKGLKARVAAVVKGEEGPTGQAIERAVEYMTKTAQEASDRSVPPQEPVVQWEEERGGVLDMPDPYFVFHLRWLEFPHLNMPAQSKLEGP